MRRVRLGTRHADAHFVAEAKCAVVVPVDWDGHNGQVCPLGKLVGDQALDEGDVDPRGIVRAGLSHA